MVSAALTNAIFHAVQEGEQRMLARFRDGRLEQEPEMTTGLVMALEFSTEVLNGIDLRLRVLASSGASSSESRFGADVCGTLRIEIDGTSMVKGFLVQAKRAGRGGVQLQAAATADPLGHMFVDGDFAYQSGIVSVRSPSDKLLRQCNTMLATTPDSFVWVYGDSQVAVVSASAIASAEGSTTSQPLGTKTLGDFFVEVSQCFIGDRRIGAWDDASLFNVMQSTRSRTGLLLEVVGRSG